MGRLACAVAAMAALVVLIYAAGSSQAGETDEQRLPKVFRDCSDCPELVVAPSGELTWVRAQSRASSLFTTSALARTSPSGAAR